MRIIIKIKISYDNEQQAGRILKVLNQIMIGCRVKHKEDGKYKKIYIESGNTLTTSK